MKFHIDILDRWWQNKGFGIESRTDFEFLHDVIREQHPYYAYQTMRLQHPSDTERQHKIRELRYRIDNALKGREYAIIEEPLKDSDKWQTFLNGRYITYDMVDIGIAIYDINRYPEHYKISRIS